MFLSLHISEKFHETCCRADSPKRLTWGLESWEYSCKGVVVVPRNCVERTVGSITIDNENDGRYTGEIQIIRSAVKSDHLLDVIVYMPGCMKSAADVVTDRQDEDGAAKANERRALK